MVMISLIVNERGRYRCRFPLFNRCCSQIGKNALQKSSTSQNNSSRLFFRAPFDGVWFDNLQSITWSPFYPELTLNYFQRFANAAVSKNRNSGVCVNLLAW